MAMGVDPRGRTKRGARGTSVAPWGLSPGFASLCMQLIALSPPPYLVAKAIRGLGYFCHLVTHIPVPFRASAINNNRFPCTEAPSLGGEGSGSPTPPHTPRRSRSRVLVCRGEVCWRHGGPRPSCGFRSGRGGEAWAGEGAAPLLSPRRTEGCWRSLWPLEAFLAPF